MSPVPVTWYHLNDSFEVSFEIEDHFNDLHVVILQLNVCKYIKVQNFLLADTCLEYGYQL